MTRKTITIAILIAALAVAVCIGLAGCVTVGVSPTDATATFGAEQFHIQLTAQAGQ